MERSIPRKVVLLACLVAVLGMWIGLRAANGLMDFDDCLAAQGYTEEAWRICDLEVR